MSRSLVVSGRKSPWLSLPPGGVSPLTASNLSGTVRKGQYAAAVRLVVARCEVTYTGRLDAYLPEATRLVMVKADGTVMVWSDRDGYKVKPLKSSR